MTQTSGEPGDGCCWRIELLGGLRAERGDRVVTRFQTQNAGALG
jgi:hypothetical protein